MAKMPLVIIKDKFNGYGGNNLIEEQKSISSLQLRQDEERSRHTFVSLEGASSLTPGTTLKVMAPCDWA